MKYKSKANNIGIQSLAILSLRIIDTVNTSGIEEAKTSKYFLQLVEVNTRFQIAIEPRNEQQVSTAITVQYYKRALSFSNTYRYVTGLLSSPDLETKEAANQVYEVINMFGKSFSKLKIAEQSLRYIRIIEALKREENAAALVKTGLTEAVAELEEAQLAYEELYISRGNSKTTKVSPSNLRKEMQDAIKTHLSELQWMTATNDNEEWQSLCKKVEQRFNEINVSASKTNTDIQLESTATNDTLATA